MNKSIEEVVAELNSLIKKEHDKSVKFKNESEKLRSTIQKLESEIAESKDQVHIYREQAKTAIDFKDGKYEELIKELFEKPKNELQKRTEDIIQDLRKENISISFKGIRLSIIILLISLLFSILTSLYFERRNSVSLSNISNKINENVKKTFCQVEANTKNIIDKTLIKTEKEIVSLINTEYKKSTHEILDLMAEIRNETNNIVFQTQSLKKEYTKIMDDYSKNSDEIKNIVNKIKIDTNRISSETQTLKNEYTKKSSIEKRAKVIETAVIYNFKEDIDVLKKDINQLKIFYNVELKGLVAPSKYESYTLAFKALGIQEKILPTVYDLAEWDNEFIKLCFSGYIIAKNKSLKNTPYDWNDSYFNNYSNDTTLRNYEQYHFEVNNYKKLSKEFYSYFSNTLKQKIFNDENHKFFQPLKINYKADDFNEYYSTLNALNVRESDIKCKTIGYHGKVRLMTIPIGGLEATSNKEIIKMIQQKLLTLKYNIDHIDGTLGESTVKCINAYKDSKNLNSENLISYALLNKMGIIYR